MKYKIKINQILTLQIYSSIPKDWIKILKEKVYSFPITDIPNRIQINNTKIEIQKLNARLLLAPDKQQFSQTKSHFIMGKHIYKL